MNRLKRVVMVSGVAGLLMLVTASSAFAWGTSTTGASGRITTGATLDPDRCRTEIWLWATDTLTDRECARWQKRDANSNYQWQWYGLLTCNGVENLVATYGTNGTYRLCRTGSYGNCGEEFWVWR
jgi:hypothetical protein